VPGVSRISALATPLARPHASFNGGNVIVLGIILLILGAILKVAILWTIGIILVVVGVILALLGAVGRGVGGRKHYY
jgi:hypothetical protein